MMASARLAASFVWSFLEQGGTKAVQLIVQIVLARLLAPELFGVLAIMLVVINVADTLAQSGLSAAIIQEQNVDDKTYTTAFWLSLALSSIIYAIVFLSSPAIASFYGIENVDFYLKVMSLVVFTNSVNSVQRTYLQRSLDFKLLFKVNTAAVVVSGAVGIVAALAGVGIWALIMQTMVQSLAACVVLSLVVPWHPSLVFRASQAKSLFSYGWKMCVTGILSTLCNSISELIIGKTCSIAQLGYYSQGRKWPTAVIGAASNSIQNVVFPALARIKDDKEAFRRTCLKAVTVGCYVVAPFSFLLVVIAEPLIVLLLTEKWLPCVPIFQMVCASYSVLMLELVNLRAYMALGNSNLYMKVHFVKLPVGIVLIGATAVLTQNIYTISAVSSAYVIAQILFIEMPPAGRAFGLAWLTQLRTVSSIYFGAIAVAIATYPINFLEIPNLMKLFVECLAFTALYFSASKLFGISGYREFAALAKGLLAGKKKERRP